MRRTRRPVALPARREFLAQSAAATIAGLLGCGDNIRRRTPPGSRLGVGIIGVGSQGASDYILGNVLARSQMQLIAIADVDATHREAVLAKHPEVAGYVDYNDLLARDDIDAIYVITPHHQHALPAIHAARAGKHVYCEKPLSLTVAEGRAMVNAARSLDIAFQTGSQSRSRREFLVACELVRNGRIGTIHEVDVAIGLGPTRAPEPANPLPDTLDWDRWLGPAPLVPYHQARAHFFFRYFHDYGGGNVTDLGAHMLDIAHWGLGRDASGPDTVQGTASYAPDSMYEEPTNVDVTLTYGDVLVRLVSDAAGVRFRGTDGEILVTPATLEASRPDLLDWEPGSGDVVLEQSLDHHQNWIDAIFSGERPICDVETGHRTASACHLANIAIQTGRALRWNPDTERFTGDAGANAMRSRPSRAGYTF